jgi:phosphate transport system ATP-binding protein
MVKIDIQNLNIWFGAVQALKQVSLGIEANEILSVIGPSNSGKTTFLRMLNRLNDLNQNFKMSGSVKLEQEDVRRIDAELLRKKVWFLPCHCLCRYLFLIMWLTACACMG